MTREASSTRGLPVFQIGRNLASSGGRHRALAPNRRAPCLTGLALVAAGIQRLPMLWRQRCARVGRAGAAGADCRPGQDQVGACSAACSTTTHLRRCWCRQTQLPTATRHAPLLQSGDFSHIACAVLPGRRRTRGPAVQCNPSTLLSGKRRTCLALTCCFHGTACLKGTGCAAPLTRRRASGFGPDQIR
jgi:hypothetical protein